MSHRLEERGLSHLVLERQRIAERWRSERWDGRKFQFPNWSVRLPDFHFRTAIRMPLPTTAISSNSSEAYAGFVDPPSAAASRATRLSRRDGGFIAETT